MVVTNESANHQSLKTFGSFKARKIVNPVPFMRKTWPTYFTIEVPDIYVYMYSVYINQKGYFTKITLYA